MTITELKEYILENDKIKDILDDLGCHGFKEYNKEYRCGLPNHNSKTNVAINKETLSTKIFTSESQTIRGDIINLVMIVKDLSFPEALKYIHALFGFKYTYKPQAIEKEAIDPLDIFKRVKKRRKYTNNIDDIELYNEEIIREYTPLLYIDWVKEGILPFTRDVFDIGYSADRKRITIPWRWWCGKSDDIVGVMGRTTIPCYEVLDIPKYFPLKAFPKSLHIYGLQENYETIQEKSYCIIYEAEKSVLKRHSRKDGTGIAIGSHDISDEQVRILIGLNVPIVVAWDKDVPLQHIRYTCSKFFGIRETYYICDKYDLLKEKDSPADANNKVFEYLLKYKIKYDKKEHFEYLKGLKNNEKAI